jgi:pyridoxine 4-dehydrogenase
LHYLEILITYGLPLFRSSLERLQIDRLGIGQLHWSTANYAPLQERALWDGLVEMYDKVSVFSETLYHAIDQSL